MSPTEPDSELIVIEKAQGGDRGAFESLLGRYRDRLEYFVWMRLGAHLRKSVEVDDVLQETSLRAYRSIRRFEWRGKSSLLRWFRGVAEHVILEVASSDRRNLAVPREVDVAEDGPSQEKALRREERFDRLQDAFSSLSPDYQKVILLARLEKLPLRVVAERMSRTPSAVKQLLWRALQKLREAFAETESLHLPDRSLDAGGGSDEK